MESKDMVEVALDGFLDTLDFLKDDFFRGSDAEWEVIMDAIRDRPERWNLMQGPLEFVKAVHADTTVVLRKNFETEYPTYAEIMTWDEFVENECMYANEKGAVLECS